VVAVLGFPQTASPSQGKRILVVSKNKGNFVSSDFIIGIDVPCVFILLFGTRDSYEAVKPTLKKKYVSMSLDQARILCESVFMS
jgi:hypothetical protein